MKKLTKKRTLAVALLCGGLIVSATTGAVLSVNASTVAPSFAIKETAAIRTNQPAGIRFETTILKSEYDALKGKNPVYGTVVNSKELVGENELVLGAEGAVNIEATNWKLEMTDDAKTTDIDESQYNQYNAVLVGEYDEETGTWAGLPEQAYGLKLVARSYVTYTNEAGDRVTEYADNQSVRSISDVAKGAIMDAEATYEADEYAYFHAITDYVAKENAMNAVEVNTVLDTLNASIPVSSIYGAVQGVYAVTGEGYTKLENGNVWTYADGYLTFTDAFLKSLEYGEYTLKVFAEKDVFELPTIIYGESTEGYARTLGFDKSTTVNNARNVKDDTTVEWMSDFEGAKGVIHIKNSSYSTGYSFVSDYSVAELKAMDWDYIEYRVYLTNTTETPWSYCSWSGDKSLGALKVNEWNIVRISKADLTTLFTNNIDSFYGVFNKAGDGFKTFWAYGTAGADVYFDYVTLGAYAFKGTETFNSAETTAYVHTDVENEWLESYNGATGVVKGAFVGDSWTGIQFRLDTTPELLAQMDWEYFEFKVTVDFTGNRTSWDGFGDGGDYWSWTEVNGWRIYRATKSSMVSRFGSLENFYKAITTGTGSNESSRMFVHWNMSQHGNFYFDYVRLVGFEGGFTFDSDAENSALKSGTSITWKESVTGTTKQKTTESGVLQFNHASTSYAGIQLSYSNDKNLTVDDWDVIYVRIRILRGESAGGTYNETATSGYGSEGSFQSGWQVAGVSASADALGKTESGSAVVGWSTIVITKAMLTANGGTWAGDINAFWSAFTSANGAKIAAVDWVHATGSAGEGWIIQLDSVGLVKNV